MFDHSDWPWDGRRSQGNMHHGVMKVSRSNITEVFELDKVHLQSREKRRPFEEDSRVWESILQYRI